MVYDETSVHLNYGSYTDVGSMSASQPATVVDNVDVSWQVAKLRVQLFDLSNASGLALSSSRTARFYHDLHVALESLVVQVTMRNVHSGEKVGQSRCSLADAIHGLHSTQVHFERRYFRTSITGYPWRREPLFAQVAGATREHQLRTQSKVSAVRLRQSHGFRAALGAKRDTEQRVYHGQVHNNKFSAVFLVVTHQLNA